MAANPNGPVHSKTDTPQKLYFWPNPLDNNCCVCIPYQTLINLCLRDCTDNRWQLQMFWQKNIEEKAMNAFSSTFIIL